VLVEFEPDHIPGLFEIAHMERDLSALFGGRKVDLRTLQDLSRYFRQRVMDEAEVQYVQGDLLPLVAALESAAPGDFD